MKQISNTTHRWSLADSLEIEEAEEKATKQKT